MEKKTYDFEDNDWANNIKGDPLHITKAESGRKGYYCIGCSKEMEAVIQKKNPKHKSFFRHVPVDIKNGEKPCTFSSREYRETLATDILQRLKRIKVPPVHKFPPYDKDQLPYLLQPSKFITAHKVRSQVWFYEDKEGNIRFGKNPNIEERYLLLRPDVVFFDVKGKPILFIELVITHKIDDEKRIKLRRMGIDTVSVIVPRASEQDIEENFNSTKRIKWEYNGIEANTEYVPVSKGTSTGILEFDEEQRRIFEEGYTCRKNRLNNTIRSLEKCLGGQSYNRIERQFEQELSRIEEATKRASEELGRLEETARNEVDLRIEPRTKEIDAAMGQFGKAEGKFRSEKKDLEDRYFRKDGELRENQNQLLTDIKRLGSLKAERARIEANFERERGFIENRIEETRTGTREFRESRDFLPERFGSLTKKESADFEEEKTRIEKAIEKQRSEPDIFARHIEEEKKRIDDEFKELRKQSAKRIDQEDSSGSDELSKRIAAVSEIRGILGNFGERQATYERYKEALELVRRGTWETQ